MLLPLVTLLATLSGSLAQSVYTCDGFAEPDYDACEWFAIRATRMLIYLQATELMA